jgi:hypothetical protein
MSATIDLLFLASILVLDMTFVSSLSCLIFSPLHQSSPSNVSSSVSDLRIYSVVLHQAIEATNAID